MSAELSDNVLVCTSPALSNKLEEYADLKYQGELDYNYHLSFEMMDFLVRYARGGYDGSERDKRCYKISIRKGCYKNPLISPFGPFTPAGEIALHNARIIDGRLKRFYERTRHAWLTPDTVRDMDEIVPYGTIQGYGVRMLKFLAELELPDKPVSPHPMPAAWHMATVIHDNDHFILMGSIRNNMYARNAADALLKFGLAELLSLPKSEQSLGKGRAPVGMRLTDMGRRFYASYQAKFDPGTVFYNRLASERQALMSDYTPPATPTTASPQSNSLRGTVKEVIYGDLVTDQDQPTFDPTAPIAETDQDQHADRTNQLPPVETPSRTVSESSDLVDGENLRDLFG